MPLSAHNQFLGKVIGIKKGAVNFIVKISMLGKNIISAMITNISMNELGLAVARIRDRFQCHVHVGLD